MASGAGEQNPSLRTVIIGIKDKIEHGLVKILEQRGRLL